MSPQCKLFNQDVGICELCYEGYGLNNGTCVVIAPGEQTNPGCQKWDGNHNCLECSVRFFFNADSVCVPVSSHCRTWNSTNGFCDTCYDGYIVNTQGECVVNPIPFNPDSNSLCGHWDDNKVCLSCSERAYFNQQGLCVAVDDYCNTWDPFTGHCLTCFKGFVLVDGACNLAPHIVPADIGCKVWDWDSQICTACSKDFVFNQN